jgi:L-seryl-tRNA(Ser) seleniumtransferase
MTQDKYGNPIDSAVSYARGTILRSSADEALRMLNGRRLVREQVLAGGKERIYNLTALTRSFPVEPPDLDRLESQFTYYAHFDDKVEEEVVRFLGGDPDRHAGFVMNRISSAMIAIMCALLEPGDAFLSIVPRGRSHPSMERGVRLAQGVFREALGYEAAAEALRTGPRPKLAAVTPITHAKHHMDYDDLLRILDLLYQEDVPIFLDDAHLSARMAVYKEPPSLQVGPVDLAIFSPDKHMIGPRAGALAGRTELVRRIQGFSFGHGIDAQTSHAAAVYRAILVRDPEPVAEAGRLAEALLAKLRQAYGNERVYPAGPGIGMSEDTIVDLARERAPERKLAVVPIEATSLLCMHLLEQHGVVTIPAVGMPGCSPAVRLMLYPDGGRFGIGRAADALDEAIDDLSERMHDREAVAESILGPFAAEARPDASASAA